MIYHTTYEDETLSDSRIGYDPKGASSITFENRGTADVTINAGIPIAPGNSFSFINEPYEVITSPFKVQFGSTGTKSLLVIRKYSKRAQ